MTEFRREQPKKAKFPIVVTLLGMVIELKLEQPLKASCPIDVTLVGITMDVKPEQLAKAFIPIDDTPLGIIVFLQPVIRVFVEVSIIALQLLRESNFEFPPSTIIDVKPEQLLKAVDSIIFTLFGIVMDVRPEQLAKA